MGLYRSEAAYIGGGGGGGSLNIWQTIKDAVNAGTVSQIVSNGDLFAVRLTNGDYLVYEACVNTYGLGEVDFIPTYCLNSTSRQHHTTQTNIGGWNQSDLRTYLNQTFISTLPSDLQAVISEKPVKTTAGGRNNEIQTSNDKIWIPTEKEVFGVIQYSGSAEDAVNNLYPIFTDAASRIRTQGPGTSAADVWLASPYITDNMRYCSIISSGRAGYDPATAVFAVLPCFRIGRD